MAMEVNPLIALLSKRVSQRVELKNTTRILVVTKTRVVGI